jgi:hypothetical protein
VLSLGLVGTTLVRDEARAKAPPVVMLGEVETLPSARALRPLLRATLEEELRATNFGKSAYKKRYVLDASLSKLESSSKRASSSSTCELSAVLRADRDGEIVAAVRGRATAEGARSAADDTRTAAMRGAARSAINKIPHALRRSEHLR